MQAEVAKDITLGFTKDQELLKQYYTIRGDMYAEELGLSDFPREKDEHDDNSDILVLTENGKVVGGVRLTMKYPESDILLPMEDDDFILDKLLPELNLGEVVYGEFSRLALAPEHRKAHLSEIIGLIGNKGREHKASFLFAIAPLIQGRMYRKYEHVFGFNLEVREDIGQSHVAKKWNLHMPLLVFREEEDAQNVDR